LQPAGDTFRAMRVLPRQIVEAIESLIGVKPNEIDDRRLTFNHQAAARAILTLLDDVPTAFIDLPFNDYLELTECRAALTVAVGGWVVGDRAQAVKPVKGKDAVERIRQLMKLCHNELPPPEPELPFVDEADRPDIESMIATAWRNFEIHDWLGCTTFGGAAMEAVILWSLKKTRPNAPRKQPLDRMYLADLIAESLDPKLISQDTSTLATQAREARNLVHAGRVAREGPCDKATALTALAGLYRVIRDMKDSVK
jgi:hypothetical protein